MSSNSTNLKTNLGEHESPLILPAADAQVRLWFLHQLQPSSPVYNIYRAIRIVGELNTKAIEQTVNALISRQGALRTTFNEVNGEIVQIIHPNLKVEVNYVDFSKIGLKHKEVKLKILLDEELQKPFDLVKGPLVKASLINLTDNEHVFFFCVHHLVFDRRSLGLLNKEFSDFYQFFSSGQSEGLNSLDIRFSDYTQWRLDKINKEDLSIQWAYWEKNLKDIKPLELPYDGKRNNKASVNGDRSYLNLPSGLIDKFENVVSKQGVTLFMGLLSVFKLLVHRWSGEEDILTGTPFTDRRLKGTENLFGFFVSTLILRTDLSGNPTFSELLSRVRKTSFNSYRYNSMPLGKIIEKLNPERIINRNPLFDLDFQLQKLQPESLVIGNARLSEVRASRKSSQYDLGFTVREKETKDNVNVDYDIRFEYRTDLFSKKTIESLLKRFKMLLKAVVDNPNKKLSDYSIVLDKEKESLLYERNTTELVYQQKNMHQYFLEQVFSSPNKVAVITEETQFSYEDIAQKACILACYLKECGVKKDSVVGILLPRDEIIPVAMLASFYLGATYLPLDPEYPVSRIKYILDDASVEHVLLEESLSSLVISSATQKIYPTKVIQSSESTSEEIKKSLAYFDQSVGMESLAYIIYTSGSTGNPKGVMLTQNNLVNFISAMKERPGISSKDVLLAVTTISFDISVLEILLPLSVGATTVIVERDSSYDPSILNELLVKHDVTIMQATPATWQMMVASGWQGKSDLKLLTGGEALSQKLSDQLVPKVESVWNMYGPTETTVWSSCYKIDKIGQLPLIGKAIANTQIYVLDKYEQLVPEGSYGELCIAGDGVSNGYFGRDDLTNKVFIDNPFYDKPNQINSISTSKKLYKTGDLVRFNSEQEIEYVGRMDFQVKVRGYRIELGEIETAINKQPSVENSVVIVREDKVDDKRIVAYVISDKINFEIDALRISLQDSLPSYMIPQHFVKLDSFPQTPNGKVDRKNFPMPEYEQISNTHIVISPKSNTEKAIAKIWSELSGQGDISLDSNFFEIGGHSLLAMQVIARAKRELDIVIKPMDMIQDTLAQIAASVDGLDYKVENRKSLIVPAVAPQFFGKEHSLFGFYYSALQIDKNLDPSHGVLSQSKGAILLCSPILMENINANWAYRRLATKLSSIGFDVLRFDYFGTGDSLGYDSDACVNRWQKDIIEASEFLKLKSNHEKVSIVGLRFGASLAAQANINFIDKLVLWEPIINGDEYVDELYDKYLKTLDDLNYIRKNTAEIKKGELIGFGFSENLERSIRSSRLLNGVNLSNSNRVILISSNKSKPYDTYLDKLSEAALNKPEEIKFNNFYVEDKSPGIEKYNDLGAFLPGKSLDVIIKELEKV